MRYFIAALLIISLSTSLWAQEKTHAQENHNHNGFEIGVGTGAFYLFNDVEWALGVHLHSVYNVGKFGVGVGLEAAFAEIKHYGIGAIFAFRPIENFELSIGPGVLLENEETGKNLFALHLEAIYSWEIGHLGHLGPVVGYGFAGNDKHLFLGVHLGVDI